MKLRLLFFLVLMLFALPLDAIAGGAGAPGQLTDAICTGNIPVTCAYQGRNVVVSYYFEGRDDRGCKADDLQVLERCMRALNAEELGITARARFDLHLKEPGMNGQYTQFYSFHFNQSAMTFIPTMNREWR